MTVTTQSSFAVLGAGSWGTALAILLARNGHKVCLWGHEAEEIKQLTEQRVNAQFLPDVPFPDNLQPETDLRTCIDTCQEVLLVVPSHALREVLEKTKTYLSKSTRIAWATKGLETGSAKFMHEVVLETLGNERATAVVSGPTFAREVATGLPTAVTVASKNTDFANDMAKYLHSDTFRAYTSTDLIGVELGGAVKNVLAIAAGISDGLGFGANARAAIITRGLAEIMRLGEALGGQRETFMGLSGVGDLVLTCTDDQSRNRRLGLALGGGQSLGPALKIINQAVEGVDTAQELRKRARDANVEMPIAEQVYQVLYQGLPAKDAVHALLSRQQRAESV